MIKFFRSIRRRLLAENRVGKYMIYALGEIILVIVGILIALWINNSNHDRISEENFEAILATIQDDIIFDTYYTKWLLPRYIQKDSIKKKIFDDQFPYEEMGLKERREIEIVSFNWENFRLQTNGYKQLTEYLADIPEQYRHLMPTLNELYINRQRDMETFSQIALEIATEYRNYMAKNQPWYARDKYSGEVSQEQIQYYRSNPRFISHIEHLHMALMRIIYGHSKYRQRAMKTYVRINDALGDKARDLPKEIRMTSVRQEEDAETLVGTFKLDAGPDNTSFGHTLEIISKGKDLFMVLESGREFGPLMFMDHENPWFGLYETSLLIRFNEPTEDRMTIISGYGPQTQWLKVSG